MVLNYAQGRIYILHEIFTEFFADSYVTIHAHAWKQTYAYVDTRKTACDTVGNQYQIVKDAAVCEIEVPSRPYAVKA